MIAFIFWGTIWGIPGAVLAVPLTSALKVVCEHVRGWEGLARLLGEPDLPHFKKKGREKEKTAEGKAAAETPAAGPGNVPEELGGVEKS
jgi:hypothetical protein